ncbi:hypothetical protein DENIT_60432 [Pseudomonas veronii]|nr:hypothetical protein DENIT_60432 [Pseudomonas veronii]
MGQIDLILYLLLLLGAAYSQPDLASRTRSKCGRGLAPDGGGSVMHVVADTLPSGASPLPHLDLHGSNRPHSVFALALRCGLIANLILQAERGQNVGGGLPPMAVEQSCM